ncbi:hypothetical protein Leryth_013132 [Lithospermum erythrorhizon]|uniref:Uncharacterized protein n=1 Tax=Lithospermum erythrorhizon TaxID=34254 RepID=A0AAV3R5B0_LITER|nr:hypothetical protein Leryth_013132 [Lithospermum erythrorhizon]
MAYRRRQQVEKVSTIKEDPPSPLVESSSSSSSSSSLAAKAIRASSAYRDSSLSSAYSPGSNPLRSSPDPSPKEIPKYEYTSMKNLDERKQGFWGVLAQKAKSIIDDDNLDQQQEPPGRAGMPISNKLGRDKLQSKFEMPESPRKTDNAALQKRFGALASSLNSIGGKIGNAIEEGLTVVENRTADIIQETRKFQIKKKSSSSLPQDQEPKFSGVRQPVMQSHMQPKTQTELDTQLKASRDVAMAMAAKAKLLLRELKTVKADLAFAKDRCGQLEEENKILRESREKGDNPDDDDLIRLQLETLLAEKARLAQENSVLARENRFLREIVEYHQLTMQDVVYLDENNEEVTEVYPINKIAVDSNQRSRSASPVPYSPTSISSRGFAAGLDGSLSPVSSSQTKETPQSLSRLGSFIDMSNEADFERH